MLPQAIRSIRSIAHCARVHHIPVCLAATRSEMEGGGRESSLSLWPFVSGSIRSATTTEIAEVQSGGEKIVSKF